MTWRLACAIASTVALCALHAPPAFGQGPEPAAAQPGPVRRGPDGRPDIQGFYNVSISYAANHGLEPHEGRFGIWGGTGVVVAPPDRRLPYQPWAREEQKNREAPERGYDDPAAHCFLYGVPRSMYTSPFQILQPRGYVVFLFERMSHRIVALDRRHELPDTIRLWQGDSVGRWEGDTLVVESKNFNGKSWLSEVGEFLSHAQQVVERFTPINANAIRYEATVTDPVVYTGPWTIAFQLDREDDEILEAACHEDNQDLKHLKDIKDAAAAGGEPKR